MFIRTDKDRNYSYQKRKQDRIEHFNEWVKGWKSICCTSCSGSGYYDHNGSPSCNLCEGTGKLSVSPGEYKNLVFLNKMAYGKEWKKKLVKGR